MRAFSSKSARTFFGPLRPLKNQRGDCSPAEAPVCASALDHFYLSISTPRRWCRRGLWGYARPWMNPGKNFGIILLCRRTTITTSSRLGKMATGNPLDYRHYARSTMIRQCPKLRFPKHINDCEQAKPSATPLANHSMSTNALSHTWQNADARRRNLRSDYPNLT